MQIQRQGLDVVSASGYGGAMNDIDKAIGIRAAAARNAAGFSLRQVHDRLRGLVAGVQPIKLSLRERGRLAWSAALIAALEDLYCIPRGTLQGHAVGGPGHDTDPAPGQQVGEA